MPVQLGHGVYSARATGAIVDITANGKEYVEVAFEILEPGYEGNTIKWRGYFSGEKNTNITLRALRTCGWQGSDLMDLSTVGADVSLVLDNETYDGKTHLRVKWVNHPGGAELVSQLDPERAKRFAAKMKGTIASFDKKSKSAPAPKAKPAPEPEVEADIPF